MPLPQMPPPPPAHIAPAPTYGPVSGPASVPAAAPGAKGRFVGLQPTAAGRPADNATEATWPVGPHLIVGFAGTKADDPGVQALRQRAEAGEIGGVIFFGYNVENPNQLRTLTKAMANWNVPAATRPLLLMVDQEGGRVQRLPPSRGFAAWPEPQVLGHGPKARAQASFAGMAQELKDLGFNVNLAPLADLARDRGIVGPRHRSFGSAPKHVAALAGMQVAAHAEAGLLSAVKHFPGHGSTAQDPHRGSADATHTWRRRELLPFAELLRHHRVDLLMSSHLVHRTLEPSGVPLTFSRAVMRTLLRDEMGYNGALITDDLGMGAIDAHFGPGDSVVGALAAGHDLLLFGCNEAARGHRSPRHRPRPELHDAAQVAVVRALQHGLLTPAMLAQSDERLATLRQRLQALAPPPVVSSSAP